MPGTKIVLRETLHDPKWLTGRYVDQGVSASAIGRELGVPTTTVMRALRSQGLVTGALMGSAETRVCPVDGTKFTVGGRGGGKRDQKFCSRRCFMLARPPIANPGSHAPRPKKGRDTIHDEAWLRARYDQDQLSTTEIGQLAGVSKETVKWHLAKRGIEGRSISEARKVLYDRRGRKIATKVEMIAAYGGRCACCGEAEATFLSLDHTFGGGTAERKRVGGQQKLLNQLKAQGWPTDDYRVLCMNCQFGTMHGKTCPHQVAAATTS